MGWWYFRWFDRLWWPNGQSEPVTLKSFFTENRNVRGFCFYWTSLACSVLKIFCPAHLFLITPRMNPCWNLHNNNVFRSMVRIWGSAEHIITNSGSQIKLISLQRYIDICMLVWSFAIHMKAKTTIILYFAKKIVLKKKILIFIVNINHCLIVSLLYYCFC